ncbi:MAG: hypothetical protein AB7O52_03715 [Planctomycetota bacterium]
MTATACAPMPQDPLPRRLSSEEWRVIEGSDSQNIARQISALNLELRCRLYELEQELNGNDEFARLLCRAAPLTKGQVA